jgi:hypothetical protein
MRIHSKLNNKANDTYFTCKIIKGNETLRLWALKEMTSLHMEHATITEGCKVPTG